MIVALCGPRLQPMGMIWRPDLVGVWQLATGGNTRWEVTAVSAAELYNDL